MDDLCARVDCRTPAAVLLVFDPRITSAWLRDFIAGDRLVGIELCVRHANRVSVPRGWELTDERSAGNRLEPVVADSAAAAPVAADDPVPDTTEPASPTLWSAGEDRTADVPESLDVADDTPLLSRAFRAAGAD